MPNRHTLHLSQIDAFADYMATRGFRREPINAKHGYEVLRLRPARKGGKLIVFYRHEGGEHATIQPSEMRAVRDFFQQRQAQKVTTSP